MFQTAKRAHGYAIVAALMMWAAMPGYAIESMTLRDGWRLHSADGLEAGGAALSQPGYDTSGWYPVTVPATVLAGLVENDVYPEPYYGDNLKAIPGFKEGLWLVMDEDSPFYPPWWYRVEFEAPAELQGKNLTLHLDGINYQANVWLNGEQIATSDEVIGMFRRFEFPVTGNLRFDRPNVLAVETIAPGKIDPPEFRTKQLEATTGWDDHNPQPPDLNMGIWQDVRISATGPVRLQHPYVATRLNLPELTMARLTVSAHATNVSDAPVTAEVAGAIEERGFSQTVQLAPGETKVVTFTPEAYPQLVIDNPRVWWPHPLGPQELYQLSLRAEVGGALSSTEGTRFGIREATTYLDEEGWRGYKINGRNILIRGGAWMTIDMLMRLSRDRYEAHVRYARDAHLNMLRSEGFSIRETEDFYSLCDEYGVMVTQQIFGRNIPDEDLAAACIEDMILRIRNHPSLVHFLGHDETFPTESLDQTYRELIARYTPERTYQPHSGAFDPGERFETGGTRTGTLELWTHAIPNHYYTHKLDGAWGFAQSGGIGGIVAPLYSLRRMMPDEALWPPFNDTFSFHTVTQGVQYFTRLFQSLEERYGPAENIEEFSRKAEVLNYDSARGMYEAYARNKYDAKGITTWKYNVAWPAALTWQYIDWYLAPTAAYFGAKKACTPLHVQYSYDDHSVYVVNTFNTGAEELNVAATVYNFDLSPQLKKTAQIDVGPDGKTEAFVVNWPDGLTGTHFLHLELFDALGTAISENFYWLSTSPDIEGEKGYERGQGFWARPASHADFTMLNELPPVDLELETRLETDGSDTVVQVSVQNPADVLAFFVRLDLTIPGDGGPQFVNPVYWSDNCFSLFPGTARIIEARVPTHILDGQTPAVYVGGWNAQQAAN